MQDCKFLFGPSLSECIKNIAQGKNFRAAVAYWGSEALSYPLIPGPSSIYYCDLLSGGTNPRVIEEIGEEIGVDKFRHVQNLHAKVYCSDKGTIVCSANFSSNGLENNIEAGVFYKDDKVADSLFDVCSEQSIKIDSKMIKQAYKAFQKGSNSSSDNPTQIPGNPNLPQIEMTKLQYSEYRNSLRRIFSIPDDMPESKKPEFRTYIGNSNYEFRILDLQEEQRFLIEIIDHLRIRTDPMSMGNVSGLIGELNGRLVLLHYPDRVNNPDNKPILRNPIKYEGKEWSVFDLESKYFIEELFEYELSRPKSKSKRN